MGKFFYSLLEPVFAEAHDGNAPVLVDNVATGVKRVRNRGSSVTTIEYHPVADFSDVVGVLEKVRKFNALNKQIEYVQDTDEFVAHVYYRAGENYCWERFAKAKEICQSVIGPAAARTFKASQVSTLIDDMISPFVSALNQAEEIAEATIWDHMGILAACEMLFPMRERHFYLANWEKPEIRDGLIQMIRAQDPLYLDIPDGVPPRTDFHEDGPMSHLLAFAYRMPQVYIDAILSEKWAKASWQTARTENKDRFDIAPPPRRP